MQAQGYYYEPRDKDVKFYNRPSFKELRKLFTNGKYAEFSAPIYADNFQQSRYWLSNTELELTIHPAKHAAKRTLKTKPARGPARIRVRSMEPLGLVRWCSLRNG